MNVVFGTRKGGAGKSSISINIASLRKMKGHDVCLVDCDDQKSTTRWNEARVENKHEPIIPIINAHGKGVGGMLREQASRYEDLIVDVPGRDAFELRASILVCDVLAIPVKISQIDLWALEKDIEMVAELQQQRETIGLRMRAFMFFNEVPVLPTVRDKQLNAMAEGILRLQKQIQEASIKICPVSISDRDAFKKVLGSGKSIFEIDEATATKSDLTAQDEIRGLYDFIFGEQ